MMTVSLSACRRLALVSLATVSLIAASIHGTSAAEPCATPLTHGAIPLATDCLFILRSAVGTATCTPPCICMPAGRLVITASDALLCLRAAVGVPVALNCGCGSSTTSTTTTTSTSTTSTTLAWLETGECQLSGVDCHSKFDCQETCLANCARPWQACYDKAAAEAAACVAKCPVEGDWCPRRCVLEQDSSEIFCDRSYSNCIVPCDGELCEGLHEGPRLEDTGLTIIDHQTMLEWEKKTDANVRVGYSWSSGPASTKRDGTAFSQFLRSMNDSGREGGCFAGHCDWRLPKSSAGPVTNRDHGELESLRVLAGCLATSGACVDPVFGPVAAEETWSATEYAPRSNTAWTVHFGSLLPRIWNDPKFWKGRVRAVRDIR